MTTKKAKKKWSAKVTNRLNHPDEGLFNQSASAIAKALASKKVSPKGPASGMRMLNFYINRAGQNLSASRKAELQKAKSKLSGIIANQKSKTQSTTKKTSRKPQGNPQKKTPLKPRSKKSSAK